jgi:hypothetical protein
MPSGDAVWLPGPDGMVECSEQNRFVPIGKSMWELGTGVEAGITEKANSDYNKRSYDDDEPSVNIDRSQIAFVFATPLVWNGKDAWTDKRRKEAIWKDVVVIDGADLQDWLEAASAVSIQFAPELGVATQQGLQSLDQAWEEWKYLTNPPTSEELVLTGRDQQQQDLMSYLSAPPNTFMVRGDSPKEAWGFVLATMRVQAEQDRSSLQARTIVCENEEVAGGLTHLNNHIIVLRTTQTQISGVLSKRGCHVIVPEGNAALSEHDVVELVKPSHRGFTEALERMGLPTETAERRARECGLSVTILQRLLPHANVLAPPWSTNVEVNPLLPIVLIGRWSDQNKYDRDILCRICNVADYEKVESDLQHFASLDDPPLLRRGDVWTLTAPVDAFQLTARYLTRSILDRFKYVFHEVFRRIDPKSELPPNKWTLFDNSKDEGPSHWLRSGLAETLLLIAERGANAQLRCTPSHQLYVEDVVRDLPGLDSDWRVLASLRDQYARLMEAAPNPFLDKLERLLGTKPQDVRRLFAEGEGVLGGGGMHVSLLWALEIMAWSPNYLSRVALILAELASIDPGGRYMNRPINSLQQIFLWCSPGTNASFGQQLAAIDLILERQPDTGWVLLTRLLPSAGTSVSTGTAKPRWRDFGDPSEDLRNRNSQYQYVRAIANRALDRVGNDPEHWRVILSSLLVFDDSLRKAAVDSLRATAQSSLPDNVKIVLWTILHDFVYQHRTYPEARWALPVDLANQLDSILPLLAPSDPIEQNRWLFDEWLPSPRSGVADSQQNEAHVQELRQQAVADIMQVHGVQGLVRLGTTCRFPSFAASAAVSQSCDLESVWAWVKYAAFQGEEGLAFAGLISGQALQTHGQAWRDLIRQRTRTDAWSSTATASLMAWWPDNKDIWDFANELGITSEYWRRKRLINIGGTTEEQVYQIERLIEAGRSTEAFNRALWESHSLPTVVLLRLIDSTFEELAKAQTAEEIRRLGLNSYDFESFLKLLRTRGDLSPIEIARREYQALPLLGPLDIHGLTIHRIMAQDSSFFVSLVCDAFRPAHRDKANDAGITDQERAKAQTAYGLLRGMDVIPGRKDESHIDEKKLLEWINSVRNIAAEVDRSVISDQQIGSILAHAPNDPEDGGWPHQVVRDIIEKLAAEEIENGLIVERFNMRGGYSKALFEGGTQERALANQYRHWAEIARARWPRMARVLEMGAEHWEALGQWEDVRAEQDKLNQ